MLTEIFKGRFSGENVETFGERYADSMIGKIINYTSGTNNISDWIILGKQINEQKKNDIIITTKNPLTTQQINSTLAEWTKYETTIKNACKNYVGETGTLGIKEASIKEVRSIILEDINNAVKFTLPEKFDEFTFREGDNNFANKQVNYYYPNDDEENPVWIKPEGTNIWKHLNDTYCYYIDNNGNYKYVSSKGSFNLELGEEKNMKYILANNTPYWVGSRAVLVSENDGALYSIAFVGGAFWTQIGDGATSGAALCYSDKNGGYNAENGTASMAIRPVVVLSSEIPWDDVKDLIGNYAQY